jgi:hypothetical protein
MSPTERATSFSPAGAAAWEATLLPEWRGGPKRQLADIAAIPWWHPDACLALDFRAGRYRCGGADLAGSAALSVVRSSSIRLFDAAGHLVERGPDELPRTDRGLYANGQFIQSAANWNAPADETVTLGTGTFTLAVWGSGSVTVAAGTAAGTGFGAASAGSPVTFAISGAGTVSLTVGGSPSYVSLTNTGFAPPAPQPPGTVLASDIRTVQGVRPSNGQAEPFPGWEAAGLDDGFTILIELETRVRNAATRRPLIFAGGTGAFRLETGTAGTGFRVYSSDGTLDGTTNFQGGLAGGPSRAAVRAQGSEIATARRGYDSVSKAARGFVQQPQSLFIGNQSNLAAPWNDWLCPVQICPPLADAKLLEWVNA